KPAPHHAPGRADPADAMPAQVRRPQARADAGGRGAHRTGGERMNVKAVVKVMNFHALLRVEASRKQAERYQAMESELENMMRIVMNNRNLRLDKRIALPDPALPALRIYLGSD